MWDVLWIIAWAVSNFFLCVIFILVISGEIFHAIRDRWTVLYYIKTFHDLFLSFSMALVVGFTLWQVSWIMDEASFYKSFIETIMILILFNFILFLKRRETRRRLNACH